MARTKTPGEIGLKVLQDAVRLELEKKSRNGQYAIVNRDGKAKRILASTLLKEIKSGQGQRRKKK